MCHDLLAKLTPGKNPKDYPACAKYKVARSLIVNMEFGDKKQPVIVLDNVGKLSQQKLAFIRYLARGKRFLLIALVESFLPEDHLFQLRASLYPSDLIRLSNLGAKRAAEFFRYFSNKHDFHWTRSHIHALATATNGYPLGMRDFLSDELERRKARRQGAGK